MSVCGRVGTAVRLRGTIVSAILVVHPGGAHLDLSRCVQLASLLNDVSA